MFALAHVSFLSTWILDTKSKLKISANALRPPTASLGRGDWHIPSVCMCMCVCAGCWQLQQYMQLLVLYCLSSALNYEGVSCRNSIYVSVFHGISWQYKSLPPPRLLFLPQAEWEGGEFSESNNSFKQPDATSKTLKLLQEPTKDQVFWSILTTNMFKTVLSSICAFLSSKLNWNLDEILWSPFRTFLLGSVQTRRAVVCLEVRIWERSTKNLCTANILEIRFYPAGYSEPLLLGWGGT